MLLPRIAASLGFPDSRVAEKNDFDSVRAGQLRERQQRNSIQAVAAMRWNA